MADFPSIQLPFSRKNTISKPQLKSEFESGTTQIRAKGTRAKEKWVLTWEHLPVADWELLKTHFKENSGTSFLILGEMINDPVDKTVIYSMDELIRSKSSIVGFYNVEIQIEEL